MVGWSIQTFAAMPEIAELVVATEPDLAEPMQALLERLAPAHVPRVVAGGPSRQASVYRGLKAVPNECEAVLVHDGARPLIRAHDVLAGMNEVRDGRAALLATRVVDTIKTVEPGSLLVVSTLDRRTLWAAQTPQFALAADLRSAHDRAREDGIEATDDATLLERIGIEVAVVPSTSENFKVTIAQDVVRAQAILLEQSVTTHVSS
jgi:2-C-methyl-D-erythritol 4-phosphate cytidylyltransferase